MKVSRSVAGGISAAASSDTTATPASASSAVFSASTATGAPMPDQPRPDNPARAVRVEDGLWHAAKARAAERGESVSDVIRRALERYVKRA